MLSILRLLLIVLCANAYLSTAVDAKFSSRFDMQLLNLQSLDAGDSFSYEMVTSMGLSVSPATDGLDVYTFSFDAGVVSVNQLPTTTMGVTNRLSYTFQRDPKSQEIFSNDIDAGAMGQVNAYFTAQGGAQIRTGRWTERARIFSPAYIDLPGENPNVTFDVRSASHDGSEIKIATYSSEQFSFRTTAGQTVRTRLVGYNIAADDWRVPLASGFALIGDIEETDGVRIPLAVRKKTLSVHPVTGREYLDPTRYVDAGLARQIDVASVFDAGSKPQQVLPSWLSDIHTAALHAEVLSGAMAEGRSNPVPVLVLAGFAIKVAVVAIKWDAIGTMTWNTSVDIGSVIVGEKGIREINPFDSSGILETKGVTGNITYVVGKGVEKALVGFGMDESSARQRGKLAETTLDLVAAFTSPKIAEASFLLKALEGTSIVSKSLKFASTVNETYNVDESINKFLDPVTFSGDEPDSTLTDFTDRTISKVRNAALRSPGYQLYEHIQVEQIQADNFVTGGFRNAGFTLPPAPSTGVFTDAAIILPLRFRLFDSGIEDGDIVRLEVRSLNGVNINPTNVTLTNQGQIFSPAVAAGPVQVRLTAINEGSISPNTGGLNILSTVTRGPSNQNFNLNQGESGLLSIVAGLSQ